MVWTETIIKVIDYIEKSIKDEIDNDTIATIACSSFYNFQRAFVFVFNMTIAEYVRYRRLSLAAIELIDTNLKIIDVALKYGYETHESFSRAFFQFHGVLPSEAKLKDYDLRYCSKAVIETNVKANIKIGKLKEVSLRHILDNLKIKNMHEINLKELIHNGNNQNVKIQTDELKASCADDTFRLLTFNEYRLPIKIDVTAKTDNANLKLIFGCGDFTLNWKYSDWNYKNNDLMIHDIITGSCFSYPNKGLIECNLFTDISWILTKDFMAIIINKELRYYNEYLPYIQNLAKNPEQVFLSKVGIAPAWGSTISVKHLCINELY